MNDVKVAFEDARCNCQTQRVYVSNKCKLPSSTNVNCPIQQIQTTLSCKCLGIQMEIPPMQCNSKAFCHFYGIKSVLLSAAQVTHKIGFMRKDLGAVAIRATFWKEV